jgi:aryl-alcohol dehydrogenase-like predicted oxidoreductase
MSQLPQSLSELLGRWTRRYCLAPLAGGVLSGKYSPAQGSDARYQPIWCGCRCRIERTHRAIGRSQQVSKSLGHSAA